MIPDCDMESKRKDRKSLCYDLDGNHYVMAQRKSNKQNENVADVRGYEYTEFEILIE